MRQLILIHGRAQENKDGAALKQEWLAAWEKGLAKSGRTIPIADGDIHFPYYGDTLFQMAGGRSAAEAAKIIIKGDGTPNAAEQDVMREMITEIALRKGIAEVDIRATLAEDPAANAEAIEKGPLNWRWVQAILSTLDRIEPLSARLIALVTADVAKYLTNPGIHDAINAGVLKAFAAHQEAVVVAHSLGTVVAYNVLMSRPHPFAQVAAPLFVTLGSPLAVNAVKARLRPHTFPAPVGQWYNALDPDDVVALYPLTPKHFLTGGTIVNHDDVDNWTDNQHGIAGYLDDAQVAKRIFDALTK